VPRHRILAVATVATLAAGLMVTHAHAAKPKCFGKTATIVAKAADEETNGTKGNDVIVGSNADDFINGKGGNDRICGRGGDDIIGGSGGTDKLDGGAGNDFVLGGTGNDKLTGGALLDIDQLFGGPGDDTITADPDDTANFGFSPTGVQVDLVTGTASGEGNDTLIDVNHVAGTEFDDVLIGNDEINFFFGQGGNDTIDGGGALDIILGNAGDDQLDGGSGFDLISYRNSVDPVTGAPVPVNVNLKNETGGGTAEGADTLTNFEAVWGSDADDVIVGNDETNYLFGEAGNDTIDGGKGVDYAAYWFETGAVNADLSTGTATVLGFTDTLIDIEALFGTIGFGDTLTGDNEDNFLDGDLGDDILNGGGGDDWILGNGGNDQINGGDGDFDLADFFADAPINANLATGVATGEGNDTLTGIEALGGADQADTLTGDANTNYFYGWGGNDVISGAGGDDFINGMAGDDTVDGGDGDDDCVTEVVVPPVNCEDTTITVIPDHPLATVAAEAENFRRSF
jgi:Ca2+-binding RTX toxin-like protein